MPNTLDAPDSTASNDFIVSAGNLQLEQTHTSGTIDSTTLLRGNSDREKTKASSTDAGVSPTAVLKPSVAYIPWQSEFHRQGSIVSDSKLTDYSHKKRFWNSWFTAYRVIFGVVLLTNVSSLITLQVTDGIILENSLNAVSTNIFIAVLVRQEDQLNMLYGIITRAPIGTPFVLRKRLADFHHYGGMHTGCAVSSVLWYITYIILSTQQVSRVKSIGALEYIDTATCYLFILFLLLMCIFAVPYLRARHHNVFETTHRFGGWAAILTLWIHTLVNSQSSAGPPLFYHPSFYLLISTTFLLILPWLRIRRIKVAAQRLSPRELMLTFPYAKMAYCTTMRFSQSPLLEWHSFATIPSPDGRTASVLIADSGDWTRNSIADPPEELWLRNPPTRNFLLSTRLFRSVLLVATGAGIGPVLSFLASASVSPPLQKHRLLIKILWCANSPHEDICAVIRSVDPAALIRDTNEGRLDLGLTARYMVKSGDLEAVFVVSNKRLTDTIVGDMKGAGVAAYGATFDS